METENPSILPQITDDEIRRPVSRIIDIDELKPYPNNTRVHTEEQILFLMHSLKAFHWRKPVAIEEGTNYIVAGHGIVEAARRLGLRKIPCEVSKDTPENHRAYRMADNRSAEMSTWDDRFVKIELIELDAVGMNLGLTGFSDEELKERLGKTGMPGTGGATELNVGDLTADLNKKCPRCGFEFESSTDPVDDAAA